MRRHPLLVCLIACAVCLGTATAATARGPVTGKVTYVGPSTVTIQTGGRLRGVVNVLTAAAAAQNARHLPYVWGGGHDAAGVASTGSRGPGYNGKRRGFDCSGSVAAVLAAGGLWPAGSPVPNDAGIISQLLQEHIIARGAGHGPSEVTLYDHPGIHILMNIDGRFFGTGANAMGGPGWLDRGTPDAWNPAFKRYHIRSALLRDRTSYGHQYTFQIRDALLGGAVVGDRVRIGYRQTAAGTMIATALQFPAAATVSGTVTGLSPDGSSFSVQTGSGATLSFTSGGDLAQLAVGDGVQVTYTKVASTLVAHGVAVTSTPAPAAGAYPPADPGDQGAGPSGPQGF